MINLLDNRSITSLDGYGATQSTATTIDGYGMAVACATLTITALSLGTLSVYLETSETGLTWRQCAAIESLATVGEHDLVAIDLQKLVRVRFSKSAIATTATISMDIEPKSTYATNKEFKRFSFNTTISDENIALALVNASETANGYLKAKYTMPLKSWGSDLSQKICHIAEYDLATSLGINAESNDYTVLKDLHDTAIKWLTDAAKGLIKPNIVDSSTIDNPSSSADMQKVVWYSSPLRGW